MKCYIKESIIALHVNSVSYFLGGGGGGGGGGGLKGLKGAKIDRKRIR